MVHSAVAVNSVFIALLRRLQKLDPALQAIVAQAFEDAALELEERGAVAADRHKTWKTLQNVESLRNKVFAEQACEIGKSRVSPTFVNRTAGR